MISAEIPTAEFDRGLEDTPWAKEFIRAFDSEKYRFFMLEWARRHRKTTVGINMLIRDCMLNSKWVSIYVAPYLKQAREIIWDDPKMLFKWLPEREACGWTKNEVKLMITFPNGSIFRLVGADKLERGRGIDCNTLFLDEFSYCQETVWTKIFMPIMSGVSAIPRKTLFGYTPNGDNHATNLFDWSCCLSDPGGRLPYKGSGRKFKPGWWVSRVTNDATGFLDPEFLELCREKWPKEVYDQEINCARVTEEQKTLITSALLASLKSRDWDIDWIPEMRRIISCDPAFGGDECPIGYFENTQLKDLDISYDRDPAKVVGSLLDMSYKHDCCNFIIDKVGVGEAVVYGLHEKSDDKRPLNVLTFDSRNKAGNDDRFGNLRSEAWWFVMKKCMDLLCAYPSDPETVREIPFASRYRLGGKGLIYIEEKDKIRELLGRSPDRAEMWMMAQYGHDRIEPDPEEPERYRDERDIYRRSRGRVLKPISHMA